MPVGPTHETAVTGWSLVVTVGTDSCLPWSSIHVTTSWNYSELHSMNTKFSFSQYTRSLFCLPTCTSFLLPFLCFSVFLLSFSLPLSGQPVKWCLNVNITQITSIPDRDTWLTPFRKTVNTSGCRPEWGTSFTSCQVNSESWKYRFRDYNL